MIDNRYFKKRRPLKAEAAVEDARAIIERDPLVLETEVKVSDFLDAVNLRVMVDMEKNVSNRSYACNHLFIERIFHHETIPIHWAASMGTVSILKLILEKRPDLASAGSKLFPIECLGDSVDCFCVLLDAYPIRHDEPARKIAIRKAQKFRPFDYALQTQFIDAVLTRHLVSQSEAHSMIFQLVRRGDAQNLQTLLEQFPTAAEYDAHIHFSEKPYTPLIQLLEYSHSCYDNKISNRTECARLLLKATNFTDLFDGRKQVTFY